MKIVSIKNVTFGEDGLGLIAGPCVIESREHSLKIANAIQEITEKVGIPYIFKNSFDKANRSTFSSYRGLGIDEGLSILSDVKTQTGIPVLTDIHEASHANSVADVADVLQIPALLCRQTDLLVAAAKTGKPVNVKKGQYLSPWDMKNVVVKLEISGCKGHFRVFQIELDNLGAKNFQIGSVDKKLQLFGVGHYLDIFSQKLK